MIWYNNIISITSKCELGVNRYDNVQIMYHFTEDKIVYE